MYIVYVILDKKKKSSSFEHIVFFFSIDLLVKNCPR